MNNLFKSSLLLGFMVALNGCGGGGSGGGKGKKGVSNGCCSIGTVEFYCNKHNEISFKN